jgi:FtsZ-binding cell division protein ZapB
MSAARAGVLPSLDAFDDEFGREETDSAPRRNTGFKLSTIIGLALAAGLITAVALGWPTGPQTQTATEGAAEKPETALQRLTIEIETLRRELGQLTQEHQRAAETIAALQAEQENRRAATWYSDLGALTYGFANQLEASAAPPPRRAVVRTRPREVLPPREESAPLSLGPQ